MRLTLSKGDMVMELDPCAGGSVQSLRHRDLDILRPGPDRCGPAFNALNYAAFPMVPFVGRIHEGRIEVDGEQMELHANLPPEAHAIHGHGWQDAWQVETQSETSATLYYKHAADAWPWDYEARQTFTLFDDALDVEIAVTNLSDRVMPAGLGWHPYFSSAGAVLQANTEDVWAVNDDTGQNRPIRVANGSDLSHARLVEELTLDDSFSVAPGPIRMTWPTHTVTLESDPLFSKVTVFVPPGETFFCAEPISQAPNAINSDLSPDKTGLKHLAKGETLSGRIRLSVKH